MLAFVLALVFSATANELSEFPKSDCNCSSQYYEVLTEAPVTIPPTSFTCWGRHDGYYADIEVDCTIFHYCQTWQHPSSYNETVKWDFSCPAGTIFNQKILSCTRPSKLFDCQESPTFYWVNYQLFNWTTTSYSISTTNRPTTLIHPEGDQQHVGTESHLTFTNSSEKLYKTETLNHFV